MEYRNLGRSGLKVSVLTLGTVTFGGSERVGNTDQDEACRQIDLCLDHGVNLIDTANVYNDGVSEEMVGTALARTDAGSVCSLAPRCVPHGGRSKWRGAIASPHHRSGRGEPEAPQD